jgi:hypothetical protein
VGDLDLVTNVDLNATSAHLTFEGEKWSKNCAMCDISWRQLIVNKYCVYHVKGMTISFLKSKWRNLVLLLHQYVTCEG